MLDARRRRRRLVERAARPRGKTRRLHQRRLRSAASRPRPLSAARARRCGDALIVGVNSDRSVRRNKGPDRPITPEARARRNSRGARLRRRRRDLRRGHAARDHRARCSRTCWSKAPTGPPTPSSAAISSKRAAAASSVSRSSRATRPARWSRRSAPAAIATVLDRRFDLRHDARCDDRHVVLFPRVRFGLREHLVGILADDHRVAVPHDIRTLEYFRHVIPPEPTIELGRESTDRLRDDEASVGPTVHDRKLSGRAPGSR